MSCGFFVNKLIANTLGKTITGLLALSISIGLTASASANSKYAAIVIDGNTGKVLHSYKADEARFPASLTKIMTLYILFDYLKKGSPHKKYQILCHPFCCRAPPL